MDDATFHQRADACLEDLLQALHRAAEEHELEADMIAGALTVEFEEPKAKFVVSPNSPVHQIWVSANVQSFKLEWADSDGTFVLPATGQTLRQLMGEAASRHLGEEIEL